MSAGEVVDFIENKRGKCARDLRNLLEVNEITVRTYHELVLCNEQLSRFLKISFLKGSNLVQQSILGDMSKVFTYERKPKTHEEAFDIMRRLVIEGSENPLIRKFAAETAEASSQRRGIPVTVPLVETLYSEELATLAPGLPVHCELVARDISGLVQNRMTAVCDPPDDYYQAAYHTLEILDFKGDCDDFAILLASILRSIGYRTFLAFQPSHVFAGVVLARPSTNAALPSNSSEDHVQYVQVPVDPQTRDFEIRIGSSTLNFNVFDLFSRDFSNRFRAHFNDHYGLTTETIERTILDLERVMVKISEVVNAEVFPIDIQPPTISMRDWMSEDIKKARQLAESWR